MSRLPNPVDQLVGKDKELYEKMKQARGRIDGMYATLLNHPALTEKVSDLGAYLRFNATLPGKYREFVILYCAHQFRAEYEWIKHVPPALEAGLDDAIIEAIKKEEAFNEPYSLFVEVAHCALNLQNIPEKLQQDVIAVVGVQGLLELVVLANFYKMIAGIIFCFDVPLPAE